MGERDLPAGWRMAMPSDGKWALDHEWIVLIAAPRHCRVMRRGDGWMTWPGYDYPTRREAMTRALAEAAMDPAIGDAAYESLFEAQAALVDELHAEAREIRR